MLPVTMILHSMGEFSPRQAFRLVPFWIPFTPTPPCVSFSLSLIASFLFSRHRRCCSYASIPFPGRFETSAASDALDEDRGWGSLNRISRRPVRSLPSFFAPHTSARLSDPQFCEKATSTQLHVRNENLLGAKNLWRIKNAMKSVDPKTCSIE